MPLAERRQIENEMIMRRVNEQVGISLDVVDANNIEDGNPHLVRGDDLLLNFRCECSDENCDARMLLKLSIYQKIHLNRSTFIIKQQHEIKSIEKVMTSRSDYSVVKKNKATTEPGKLLNVTSTSIHKAT
jgi:hypothetical protein